jgi:hypothetical protein
MTSNDRLRRELRAMAAVNRQLQVSSSESAIARGARRSGTATPWIEDLAGTGVREARLVKAADGAVFVVEGQTKRPLRSGLLAAAVEQVLGGSSSASGDELQMLDEGAPVELLEASKGAPFVVIGGRRHTVTGLPLPYPVDDLAASEMPEGDVLDVAAANIARRRFEEAMSGRLQVRRATGSIARKGVVGTVRSIGRRAASKVKQTVER